ncbi:glycoside hydrolase family 12 protein [Cucurbitaria berberidis CBS 394.84]|uniref:Glycoside hydrolase family 12 protein n=1 Tax=Cucurbitaria berberidis CBS 394.84 TaxID=1168544 RepID=A0A9P4GFA2_9PLEO|nr:glycoside hydrolase family 12 protein [Cucurbitaria berberidis CBS 394.84]KAF1844302.1 glycoside hydrolase family 12 protein [Cucurbitaria berberidis CBS 394.84]
MKLATLFFASAASLALAAPAATVQKRADYCGQWDNAVNGPYTTYNNLWGRRDATSGSQCTGVDGFSGNTIKWHTSWSWAGGPGKVKSYANVVTKISQKAISSIKALPSTWSWAYSGSSVIANVSFDLFTSSTAAAKAEYEVMIWVAALGGAGPISFDGKPIATITLAGSSWRLFKGKNGDVNVFSFVAVNEVRNFKGDLMEFLNYLINKQGLPKTQILQSVGAGTEPFSGSNAKLTVSGYTLSQS